MKLQVLSLLVILIAFTAVGQKTDSITKYNLRISTFNDSWGGGFTRIKDDYRSYGICTFIEMPNKFSINTQLSGFTNKVSKQPTNQTRLDELLISGKFLIKKDFFKYLDIYGIIGLYDLNNYHGENIQNSTHQLFGVSEVKLPYSNFRGTFYQLGTTLIASKLLLKSYSSTLLYLQPSIETFIIPDYFATFNPKLPIKLESTKGSSFSLAIGYQYSSLITTNPLLMAPLLTIN